MRRQIQAHAARCISSHEVECAHLDVVHHLVAPNPLDLGALHQIDECLTHCPPGCVAVIVAIPIISSFVIQGAHIGRMQQQHILVRLCTHPVTHKQCR